MQAIGSGGEDFAASIRAAAESVLGPLPERAISLRPSRDGNYVSVNVGPVQVCVPPRRLQRDASHCSGVYGEHRRHAYYGPRLSESTMAVGKEGKSRC